MNRGPLAEVVITHQKAFALDTAEYRRLWGEEAPSATATFLVDTGSPYSLVDHEILDSLHISPTIFDPEVKIGGFVLRDVPIYPVHLQIRARSGVAPLETTVYGVPVGILPSRRFQAILGRGSLQQLQFTYDGAAGIFDLKLSK